MRGANRGDSCRLCGTEGTFTNDVPCNQRTPHAPQDIHGCMEGHCAAHGDEVYSALAAGASRWSRY